MEEDQELAELLANASRVRNRMEVIDSLNASVPALINDPEIHSCPSISEPHTPSDSSTCIGSSYQEGPSALPQKQRRLAKKCIKKQAKKRVKSLWQIAETDVVFYGTVHVEPPSAATEFAQAVCKSSSTLDHLALWTHASVGEEPSFGYAVASQFQGEGWKYRLGRSSTVRDPTHADMKSIKMAMEEAVQHARQHRPSEPAGTVVRIFSPSKFAVTSVSNLPFVKVSGTLKAVKNVLQTLEEISELSGTLKDLGAELSMHWVPSKANVAGDHVAKSAAKYARLSPHRMSEEDWRPAVLVREEGEAGPSSERVEREDEDVDMQEDEDVGMQETEVAAKERRPWWKGLGCLKLIR